MKNLIKLIFFFSVFFLGINFAMAQYTMQDLTVSDCYGTLTDSDNNPIAPGYYNHNENFSFTICPPGALSITITFISFATEPTFDYLRIFNGTDTLSPLIAGPYSGINLPLPLIATGCITINFISDNNIAVEGFELSWEAQIAQPQPPVITIPVLPPCSTSVLNINLDQNIDILDVMMIVNEILDFMSFTELQKHQSDLCADFDINILDILVVVNLIID